MGFPLTRVASELFTHSAFDSIPPESNLPPQIPASSLIFKLQSVRSNKWLESLCEQRNKESQRLGAKQGEGGTELVYLQ